MSVATTIQRALGESALARLLRGLGSCVLAGVALTWVASHAGSREGVALVHVTEPDVVVIVGDSVYEIAGCRYTPLRCTLPAGRHELRMYRDGELLHSEGFRLRGGEERVLTAWRSEDAPVAVQGRDGSEATAGRRARLGPRSHFGVLFHAPEAILDSLSPTSRDRGEPTRRGS
jgi:hypothetical protein